MEAQDIFDRVSQHLLSQGVRSTDEEELDNMYRGSDGTRCAAGVLIPDDEFDPAMEGMPWPLAGSAEDLTDAEESIRQAHNRLISIAERVGHHSFVKSLQLIHDVDEPSRWQASLTILATKEGLSSEAIDGAAP